MRDIMAGMDEKNRECCCSSTCPLYMTVTCLVFVLPRCPGLWFFLGDDFRNCFRMLLLGSTVVTCSASVYVCFWKNFIFSTLRLVRTGNLDIISTSSSYDVADGFFAAFFGIFRTPSAWT